MDSIEKRLLDRFLRYVSVPSQSRSDSLSVPSTGGQRELALLLSEEVEEMGLEEVFISEESVLTAKLPKNAEGFPAIGWICHLDTVDVGLSPTIRPMVVENYSGEEIKRPFGSPLNTTNTPELKDHIGKTIVFSDGSSVLGADNKSAISIVMEALSIISSSKEMEHGDIYVAFTPDEEVGLKGAKALDISRFPVDWAYTIDCCAKGEVVWETFNAGEAKVTIEGVTAHPMSSKGILVNPILIAHDFTSLLDRHETPENTEGKEGYIWLRGIEGNAKTCTITLSIRDHNREKYEEKKKRVEKFVERIQNGNPRSTISLSISDTYSNLLDCVNEKNSVAITNLKKALERNGIVEKPIAMRGGTDGSFISTKGILVPNYFTGALNFHSSKEFWPLEDGRSSLEVTLTLMTGGKLS